MEAAMAPSIKGRVMGLCLGIGIASLAVNWATNTAIAQTITVDAAPSHVANTFSPVRSKLLELLDHTPAVETESRVSG